MKIIECPRDAMQGLEKFIPTADKVRYINQLMKVGFDTIDAGSFVSAKAIPQMSDTAEVMEKVERGESNSLALDLWRQREPAPRAVAAEQPVDPRRRILRAAAGRRV